MKPSKHPLLNAVSNERPLSPLKASSLCSLWDPGGDLGGAAAGQRPESNLLRNYPQLATWGIRRLVGAEAHGGNVR